MAQLLSLNEIITRTIDADPTPYAHVMMRSKLEVAFARHLDRQGIPWEYEPAIFGRPGAGYLPDFLISQRPGDRCYVEVKPTLAEAEAAKSRMTVIWQTYPDAVLLIVSAEGSRFFAALRNQPWESWSEAWAHR